MVAFRIRIFPLKDGRGNIVLPKLAREAAEAVGFEMPSDIFLVIEGKKQMTIKKTLS